MSSTPSAWATFSQIGSSAIRLEAARTYIRQTSRYRILLTLLVTLVTIGAEVWAVATYLNGRNPIAEGVYAVDEKQGWINLAAFVVGLLGFLGVAVLLTKAIMGIWAKWDRVVYENILQN